MYFCTCMRNDVMCVCVPEKEPLFERVCFVSVETQKLSRRSIKHNNKLK